MKKIVILNASPRPNGLISSMLSIIEQTLMEQGAEVEAVNVCHLQVKPCVGCMACRLRHDCMLPADDAQRVLRLVQECDAVVVGTPCYWGNMNGQLKVLFDRWAYGMMDEVPNGFPKALQKGKRAVILSTCTTIWPWNRLFHQSSGAVRAVKEVLKWSGFRIVGTLQKGGTRKRPDLSTGEIRKCKRLAQKLL